MGRVRHAMVWVVALGSGVFCSVGWIFLLPASATNRRMHLHAGATAAGGPRG